MNGQTKKLTSEPTNERTEISVSWAPIGAKNSINHMTQAYFGRDILPGMLDDKVQISFLQNCAAATSHICDKTEFWNVSKDSETIWTALVFLSLHFNKCFSNLLILVALWYLEGQRTHKFSPHHCTALNLSRDNPSSWSISVPDSDSGKR